MCAAEVAPQNEAALDRGRDPGLRGKQGKAGDDGSLATIS
jgi:hypothetical protein